MAREEQQILFGVVFCFIFVAATQIVIVSESELQQVSPAEMAQDEFEPSAARLFLVIDAGVIQRVLSLDLGPLFAEEAFEKMLPSDFVLGVDERSDDGFAIVGAHLEALVWRQRLRCLMAE